MSECSSIELGDIEMYGMTSAEIENLIKANGELKTLRYFEYQTSKAFSDKDYAKALRAYNRIRYILDVRLFPEQ